MRIALAGNPNSGKTTLFNALTGKSESVGNWAGVTVDRKEAVLRGRLQGRKKLPADVRAVDLPGAYSISPYSKEESITRAYILNEHPDVIVNVVDAGALERGLLFTLQLSELGVPMVLALNKSDLARRSGHRVDLDGLSSWLGCPVVELTANRGDGLKELIEAVAVAAERTETRQTSAPKQDAMESDLEKQKIIGERMKTLILAGRDASKGSVSDWIDRIVANSVLGIPIFALVIWAIYSLSINGIGGGLSGYVNDVLFGEIIPVGVYGFLDGIGVNPLLSALIVDGAIGGMGAVLGFLPLIMVLFFLLALLEDSGYMARVAVVMDRWFKKIGLSGKSIIPMIVGTGCAIPGVMATRTIEDENERRMTIMLTPFIPCGAKLPIIALFTAVFFPNASWMFPAMYVFAGVVIVLGGLLLKRIYRFDGETTFIIELPKYKVPSLKYAASQMLRQGKAFIVKATTIILVMNTLIWLLQTYTWNLQVAETQSQSMLATVGGLFVPLLLPIGFATWQLTAAALTGFIAKENVVATLAVILAASDEALMLPGGVLTEWFTPVTAVAFMVFNLFTPPCFAAIGAMNAEFGKGAWLAKALAFQIGTGYVLALLVTHVGTLLTTGRPAPGLASAVAVLAALTVLVTVLIRRKSAMARSDVFVDCR